MSYWLTTTADFLKSAAMDEELPDGFGLLSFALRKTDAVALTP